MDFLKQCIRNCLKITVFLEDISFSCIVVFLTDNIVDCVERGNQYQSPSRIQAFINKKSAVRIVTVFETSILCKTFCLPQTITCNAHIPHNCTIYNIL